MLRIFCQFNLLCWASYVLRSESARDVFNISSAAPPSFRRMLASTRCQSHTGAVAMCPVAMHFCNRFTTVWARGGGSRREPLHILVLRLFSERSFETNIIPGFSLYNRVYTCETDANIFSIGFVGTRLKKRMSKCMPNRQGQRTENRLRFFQKLVAFLTRFFYKRRFRVMIHTRPSIKCPQSSSTRRDRREHTVNGG